MKRVLIACEFSGIVRESFRKRGFDAWSCDLLPTEIQGQHIQGDVLEILNDGWDLMIAHPPCTHLSFAGVRYWNNPGKIGKRLEALTFFAKLWECDIQRICIENPMGIASSVIIKHHQIIHPYFFGDRHLKRTCLWLKNLPLLEHSADDNLFNMKTHTKYPNPIYTDKNGKKRYFTDALSSGHDRSRTFTGIAEAMAEQWGKELMK